MAPQIPLTGSIGLQGSAALLGYTTIVMTDADYTLSAEEAAALSLVVTSSEDLTQIRTLNLPANQGQTFVVFNFTTGGYPINVTGDADSENLAIGNGNNGAAGIVVSFDGYYWGDYLAASTFYPGIAPWVDDTNTLYGLQGVSDGADLFLVSNNDESSEGVIVLAALGSSGTINMNLGAADSSGIRYQFAPAAINDQTSNRAFGTSYQNTSYQNLQVSGHGTTSGSSTGTLTASMGPDADGLIIFWDNTNTASVGGGKEGFCFTVPPGWYYEIDAADDITGVGRWVELLY